MYGVNAGQNGNMWALYMRRNRAAHRRILGSEVQTHIKNVCVAEEREGEGDSETEREEWAVNVHDYIDRATAAPAERLTEQKERKIRSHLISKNIKNMFASDVIIGEKYVGCCWLPSRQRLSRCRDWGSFVQNKLDFSLCLSLAPSHARSCNGIFCSEFNYYSHDDVCDSTKLADIQCVVCALY